MTAHAAKDQTDKVRSLEELVHIYNNSVGGNATFLLNIPPTSDGLLHENDVKRLAELGEYIRKQHNFELQKCESNIICVDSKMAGVGSNACGPALAPEYRLPLPSVSAEFYMQITSGERI